MAYLVSNIHVGHSLICFGNNKNIYALFSTLRKTKTNVKTNKKHNSKYGNSHNIHPPKGKGIFVGRKKICIN